MPLVFKCFNVKYTKFTKEIEYHKYLVDPNPGKLQFVVDDIRKTTLSACSQRTLGSFMNQCNIALLLIFQYEERWRGGGETWLL